MAFFLGGAAFLAFFAGYPASALLLRCALEASERFSPRAALALASVAALFGALCALPARGGLRPLPPSRRAAAASGAFIGGTLGRSALLLYASHFTGSLELTRAQAGPLLLLVCVSLYALFRQPFAVPEGRGGLFGLALFCGLIDGLFGAGGMALSALFSSGGVLRRKGVPSSLALLVSLCAQSGALLLTLCAGAAQVLPLRMLLGIAIGAAAGGFGAQKQRGTPGKGLRAALMTYLVIAVLSILEQALRPMSVGWGAS